LCITVTALPIKPAARFWPSRAKVADDHQTLALPMRRRHDRSASSGRASASIALMGHLPFVNHGFGELPPEQCY
jgi:hypothetical protein